METELTALKRFTPIHLFKLRTFAKPCPLCVNDETGQAIGTSVCRNCYGTQKDKGYFPPVMTYARFMAISPVSKLNSQDGTGATDPSRQSARMLAYPQLYQGDMLVHKEADKRYLVNFVDYAYFAGKAPVIATVDLALLDTSDVRYKLTI